MSQLETAKTIRDAYRVSELDALQGKNLAYWVDLRRARASQTDTRLTSYLELRDPDQFVHVAFTGHRGCGKSTELMRLIQQWEREHFVVYFEVTELLDPNDIVFSDLFLTIAMKLAQTCDQAGLPLERTLLDNVENFAASVIKETIGETETQLEVSTRAEAGVEIPFVAKLKAWITSQFKASTQHKETIRRVFERDITRLITDTNLLLHDARKKVKASNASRGTDQHDLLIIIDNLDRIPPEVGERLISQHGDFLKQIHCNVIYTIPVSVLHSPKGLSRVFPSHDILPMVRLYEFDLKKIDLEYNQVGVEALVEVVKKRIDLPTVFESEELVSLMAHNSGGCVRHLMQFVRDTCMTAHGRGAAKISQADVEDSLRRMQFDFERMIPPEHYPLLAEVARDKTVRNDDLGRQALYNLSVLEYNGDKRWNYVHPLVKRIERFRQQLHVTKGKGKKRG